MTENINNLLSLAKELECEVLPDEPLCLHTSFRIGGPCRAMIQPSSAENCMKLLKFAKESELKFTVIGNGSNLLCDDKGYSGVIFKIGAAMGTMAVENKVYLRAGAGASLTKLSSYAGENELTGLEFAFGIPGSVGGAVFMNAGAYGGEVKDVIVSCDTVDAEGNFRTFTADEMELSYRSSIFQKMKNTVITSALFCLKKGEKSAIAEKMSDLMSRRKDKQPLDKPSAGSAFKRPVGQFAGKLIQDCGLKGFAIGGAQVSEKHSGFIINTGNASSSDVKALIEYIQKAVMEKTGVYLESEIRILDY